MAVIGDWIWYRDEYGNKYVAQITGFDNAKNVRVFIYPENPGGIPQTRFTSWNGIEALTVEEKTNVPVQDAYEKGYTMAKSLRAVFGNSNADYSVNPQAVFALGRQFATMTGYGNLEDGFRYIEGFVTAFQEAAPKQIATMEAADATQE